MVYKKTEANYTLESAGFGGGRIFSTPAGALSAHYQITDHLGSVRVAFTDKHTVLSQNDYYAYGKRHVNSRLWTVSDDSNRFLFNGKEAQITGELGLLDFGARMYSSEFVRFPNADPLTEVRRWVSPFAYCQNNPVNRIDPTGMLDDKWEYDLDEDEVRWLSDEGGNEYQTLVFTRTNENGEKEEIASATVSGEEVFVGYSSEGYVVSNVDLWKDMPSGLSGYNGYTYNVADLRMRHFIMNSKSRVLKVGLANYEAEGWAEALTGTNYWNLYGDQIGALKSFRLYFTLIMSVAYTPETAPTRGNKSFVGGNYKVSTGNISTSKPSFQEFNAFRSANKGAFTGHSGRGSNTKAAWDAYLKHYGY